MPRLMLNNQHWKKLKPILQEIGIYEYANLRKTVEGILYKMRTGIPWRDLPRYFGKTNTIFKAFNRWSQSNKLIKLFEKMINFPDMEWLFIDATYIKAHQHSSSGDMKEQGIDKSVAGNTSKIHLAVDAHGNPIRFIITDGVTHDVKAAPDLIDTLDLSDVVVLAADKGYDSQCFREKVEESQTIANIPRRRNTKLSNEHMDWHLYKSRHLVENAFCRIKHYRGIATRYEKLKRNYENLVALAFAYHWLKL